MIKKYQVRSQNNSVYFAKRIANRSEIHRLTFHKKFNKRIDTELLYHTSNRVLALQTDISTVPLHKLRKNKSIEIKESLYILDDKATLHCLQSSDEFNNATLIDFSEHSLDKIIDHDWAHTHLSPKAVTFSETIYAKSTSEN